jgi:hypothetical protein
MCLLTVPRPPGGVIFFESATLAPATVRARVADPKKMSAVAAAPLGADGIGAWVKKPAPKAGSGGAPGGGAAAPPPGTRSVPSLGAGRAQVGSSAATSGPGANAMPIEGAIILVNSCQISLYIDR